MIEATKTTACFCLEHVSSMAPVSDRERHIDKDREYSCDTAQNKMIAVTAC